MPKTHVALRRARARHPVASGDSCGCAMSARFGAVALIASTAWWSWHWHDTTLSLGDAVLRVLFCAFVSAGVGKLVGILQFRTRRDR